MLPIALIAMDVDGTLLYESKISQENIDAMRKAQDKHIIVGIATGRIPANMHETVRSYGLRCPVMGINGCYVTDEDYNTIDEHFLPRDISIQVQEVLAASDTEYNVNYKGGTCLSLMINSYPWDESYYEKLRAYGIKVCFGEENASCIVRNEQVYKLFAYNCNEIEKIRERLSQIKGLTLSRSGPNNIEIMPAGIDKATGVKALADYYCIPMKNVMTLGDEMNDIPMLRAAGWGIAMGNGSEEAKAAARYTTAQCKDSGVAKAIWRFAL